MTNMAVLIILLIGFFGTVTSHAVPNAKSSAVRCELAFYDIPEITSYQGFPLLKDNGFSIAPRLNEFRSVLGSGIGGEVVRVHNLKTDRTQIEKTYFDDPVFKNDILAMNFLKAVFDHHPSNLISSITIKEIDYKYRRLVLEDSSGSDFGKVMRELSEAAQESESANQKLAPQSENKTQQKADALLQLEQVKALFSRGLVEAYRAISRMETRRPLASLIDSDQYYLEFIKLEPASPHRQANLRAVVTLYPANHGKIQTFRIYLKPDNVLLQPDRRLKIIDAY